MANWHTINISDANYKKLIKIQKRLTKEKTKYVGFDEILFILLKESGN